MITRYDNVVLFIKICIMTQGPFGVHKQSDLVILYFLCAKTSAAIILELELSEGLEYSVLFVSVFCWRTFRVKKKIAAYLSMLFFLCHNSIQVTLDGLNFDLSK